MILIRGAFWLGVAVLLLPSDEGQQAKVLSTVSGVFERAVTFCDRNQTVCQKGSEFWVVFVRKAEFGMRMAMDLASERSRAKGDADPARTPAPTPTAGDLPRAPVIPQGKVRTETIAPTKTSAPPAEIEGLLRDVGA